MRHGHGKGMMSRVLEEYLMKEVVENIHDEPGFEVKFTE
jgi:hypothetical protein